MAFALTRDTLLCPDNQRELLKMRKPRHAKRNRAAICFCKSRLCLSRGESTLRLFKNKLQLTHIFHGRCPTGYKAHTGMCRIHLFQKRQTTYSCKCRNFSSSMITNI